ncbi:MAG: hypothetical protein R3B72_38895 [Polyangiaceae bacterium]
MALDRGSNFAAHVAVVVLDQGEKGRLGGRGPDGKERRDDLRADEGSVVGGDGEQRLLGGRQAEVGERLERAIDLGGGLIGVLPFLIGLDQGGGSRLRRFAQRAHERRARALGRSREACDGLLSSVVVFLHQVFDVHVSLRGHWTRVISCNRPRGIVRRNALSHAIAKLSERPVPRSWRWGM